VVQRGEIFGLIGPSGAGKTTILRMLCGLLSPSSGTARVAGFDLRRAPAAARALVGYMGQGPSLYGELSIVENFRFLADAYDVERRQREDRIERLVAEFGLGSCTDPPFDALPFAARQRAALAATLVHEPEIILLDDPTAGGDPRTRRALWRCIEALAAAGGAVLVASRLTADGAQCDHLLLAHDGRAIATGRPDELVARGGACDAGAASLDEAFAALIADRQGRDAA
jgi:ABC-2 type transport system ATP-binding protein